MMGEVEEAAAPRWLMTDWAGLRSSPALLSADVRRSSGVLRLRSLTGDAWAHNLLRILVPQGRDSIEPEQNCYKFESPLG